MDPCMALHITASLPSLVLDGKRSQLKLYQHRGGQDDTN